MGIVPTAVYNSQQNEDNGYFLGQNYPNPFISKTIITFRIPQHSFVSLKVFNILGVEITELAGKVFEQGTHSVEFGNYPKGKYLYRFECNNFIATHEMTVIE